MFTGLIEDVGTVERAEPGEDAVVLVIAPERLPVGELVAGESVAVDGTCLTVTGTDGGCFTALAGTETLRRTTLGAARPGQTRVNLERAMRAGDRLGGHLVSGHVDAVGEIVHVRDLGANIEVKVAADRALLRYVVEKGSVAVDGISLTVNRASPEAFEVALIPHTAAHTTLAEKSAGQKVNLEVDVIAKYVEKLVAGYGGGGGRDGDR